MMSRITPPPGGTAVSRVAALLDDITGRHDATRPLFEATIIDQARRRHHQLVIDDLHELLTLVEKHCPDHQACEACETALCDTCKLGARSLCDHGRVLCDDCFGSCDLCRREIRELAGWPR